MVDLEFAREVLRLEAAAVEGLVDRLDARFVDAVERVLACPGRVVVTGIGKARLIGQKISATLASTGTPAFDLHAAEALHGDLGRIGPGDLALILSNSGKSREVLELIDPIKKMDVSLIALTGNSESALALHADVVLDIGRLSEACPLGLAPSTTTTAMLALGDALALTVQKARRFGRADYARFHPAGELGRRLMKVSEVMREGPQVPHVNAGATVLEAIVETTRVRAGAASIIDDEGVLLGIFTNGDLGRLLAREADGSGRAVMEVMTRDPKTISPERLASEAFRMLHSYKIDELPVVDDLGRLVGLVDVQDFLGWSA